MMKIGFFLCLLLAIPTVVEAQTPLLRNPDLLELEAILSEYGDIESSRIELDLESGTFVLLELDYAELPQTVIRVLADDGDVYLMGYFNRLDVNPDLFLLSEDANDQDAWGFEKDSDGDLSYSAVFTPESKEDMETLITVYLVLLDMIIEPHLISQDAEEPDDEMFDVAGCARSMEQAFAGLPDEIRKEYDIWSYCDCLSDRLKAEPELLSSLLQPASPGGKKLIESCFESFIPNWEALGLTPDMLTDSMDPEHSNSVASRAYVKECVRTIMEDPENQYSDLSYGAAEEYCGCVYDEMASRESISMEEMANVESDAFVEITAVCLHLLAEHSPAGWNKGKEAEGCDSGQRIPLLWDGSGYQMRLNLGGVTKYILLDTGASEVVISRNWYNELRDEGVPLDYVSAEFMEVADGSSVRVERYKVAYLTIGTCTFRDFNIGVIQEGGMLCGMGLLGLFDNWSIDTRNAELTLNNE